MDNRKIHNKLVRDRIPEIIRANAQECQIKILSDADYIHALRDKLIEEASEVADAGGDDLIKELADLYEVIDAMIDMMGIAPIDVKKRQTLRRKQLGGFEQKIQLVWANTLPQQQ